MRLRARSLSRSRELLRVASEVSALLLARSGTEALEQVLADLGRAVSADRAYLFECLPLRDRGPGDPVRVRQTAEWAAPGVEPQIGNPLLRDVPLPLRWSRRFERGLPVSGRVRLLSREEREVLEPQGVLSLLAVPLRTDRGVLGFLGFDDCCSDGGFGRRETELLRTVASAVGAFLERERAKERLEALVAERTRESRLSREKLVRRSEELARMNAELTRGSRLIREFLSGVTHELKTPLGAMINLTEALRAEDLGPLTSKQARALGTIEECGRHLLALVEDLLDLSRIEAGRFELTPVPVGARLLVESALSPMEPEALRKGIRLRSLLPEGDIPLVGDARRIRQVLTNFLSNAVKFSRVGGEVRLEVRSERAREAVRFDVTDQGIGIAPADLPRLFVPFSRLEEGLDRRYPGTGLGLAWALRIAELHRGSIAVESRLGGGSRFTLFLPLRESSRLLPPPDAPVCLAASVSEPILRSLEALLERFGLRFARASSLSEALGRLAEDPVRAIFLDVRLCGEGWGWVRRFRVGGDPAAPLALVAPLERPMDRRLARAVGADAFLTPPFDTVALAALLSNREKCRE
jgi:signal transduction histidine kinase/CheY-like chemotaxis protein